MSSTGQWDELFGSGQKWRVAEEVTGTIEQNGCLVTFERGQVTVAAPGAYQSPLSTNMARKGVLCVRTDAAGAVDIPGTRQVFGAVAVERARREFQAVW